MPTGVTSRVVGALGTAAIRGRFELGLRVILALLVVGAIGSCRRRAAPPSPPPAPVIGATQVGVASWYGPGFHGRRTANGEVYDMHGLTAAHKTLPFDTVIKVHNLENQKSTVVRINDRGPFVKGRIIDLSRTAASRIDMIRNGTARVRLEIVQPPPLGKPAVYTVQVGAFRIERNARKLHQHLTRHFGEVSIEPARLSDETFYRVRVGRTPSLHQAQHLVGQLLRQRGVDDAVVVRLE